MSNLHRALEVLTRLPQTPSQAVNELTASVRAVAADALKTLAECDAEIGRLATERGRLLSEVEYLTEKLAQRDAKVKRLEDCIGAARRQLEGA
jgi:chromosome segregation ATPase